MSEDTDSLLDRHPDGAPAGCDVPQRVPVNMWEAEQALVIVAPLPGVMADDVDVTVESGRVVLRAACRTPAPKPYVLHEWHYGPYEREIDLPAGFGGRAEATFANGQLALRVERGDGDGVGRVRVVGKPGPHA